MEAKIIKMSTEKTPERLLPRLIELKKGGNAHEDSSSTINKVFSAEQTKPTLSNIPSEKKKFIKHLDSKELFTKLMNLKSKPKLMLI